MSKNSIEENLIAKDLLVLIKDLIKQELSKIDTVSICQVVNVNNDKTCNVYVVPNNDVVVRNIPNMSNAVIEQDDYVYVYKVKNQFSNAFIIGRINKGGETLLSKIESLESVIARITNDEYN